MNPLLTNAIWLFGNICRILFYLERIWKKWLFLFTVIHIFILSARVLCSSPAFRDKRGPKGNMSQKCMLYSYLSSAHHNILKRNTILPYCNFHPKCNLLNNIWTHSVDLQGFKQMCVASYLSFWAIKLMGVRQN